MTFSDKTAITGVGETDFVKGTERTAVDMMLEAARKAIADAGLKPSDIDGLLTAYSFTEPYFMLGSVMCEYLGLKPRYNASMVVGGVGASSGFTMNTRTRPLVPTQVPSLDR